MYKNFTRGIIAGTVVGMTLGMMFPTRNAIRTGKRFSRSGKSIMRRASEMFDNMIDIW